MAQGIEKQIGTVTAIKAKAHFVKIGLQVLRADAVPSSNDSALQQRESRFNGVGMNVGSKADILFRAVIHGLMPSLADRLAIGAVFVSHYHVNILRNVLLNVPCQSAALGIFRMEEPHIPAALANTNDDELVAVAEPGFAEATLL